ncbi:GNAT family N-acetyltransferase [Streptomyces collinus]|uniref:RimJ/RimL family protein N-acetyltransferase n=2 Tax=Streptomyces TaxID=1883 RepID=A0AA89QNQ6_STRCU|nr:MULTISPECIES: GNAT family N-acetyltransferase [Streptomyces]MBB5815669.1 RimJ/RimL family protein N-acetyltransferase [Streptomyces collinus]MEC7058495.1 GNAT family N-acetyltransferase [Streptomyces violaceochromogenes]WMX68561.1 GNAT family N-acetyltransferase [Streptomyces collinus]
MDPVTLETGRLVLRPFGPGDADAVYDACQDKDIQFYTPVPVPFGRQDAEKRVREEWPQGWAGDDNYILGAFRKDTSALVGSYCLTRVSRGVYELGYWAVKEQRGRGYTVEAARALCDWGWATLDVHRIEWWAMTGNTGSRAVAERLGFTVEGTLRNRGIANDGKPHDWWVGALVRP